MTLPIDVYRNAGSSYDCTMNGVSARFTRLNLVEVGTPAKADDDTAVVLVKGPTGLPVIKPAVINDSGFWAVDSRWLMFGGNFASTSDSRFGEAIRRITGHEARAVPVHDRYEG